MSSGMSPRSYALLSLLMQLLTPPWVELRARRQHFLQVCLLPFPGSLQHHPLQLCKRFNCSRQPVADCPAALLSSWRAAASPKLPPMPSKGFADQQAEQAGDLAVPAHLHVPPSAPACLYIYILPVRCWLQLPPLQGLPLLLLTAVVTLSTPTF